MNKSYITISFILLVFYTNSYTQTTYTESPMSYDCGNYDSGGDGIRFRVWPTPISGNIVTFRIRKAKYYDCSCSGSCDFGTAGTMRIREGSITGPTVSSCSMSSCGGDIYIDLDETLTHQSGSINYYATIEVAGFTYWAGPISITATPSEEPQLVFSECILGNSEVIQGQNYTCTFEVENIGEQNWTGDIVAIIVDNDGDIVQTIYDNDNISLDPNENLSLSTGTDEINLPVGAYKILIAYTNAPFENGNAFVSSGGCTPTLPGNGYITHYKNLIVLPIVSGLELNDEILAMPNPFVQNDNGSISTQIINSSPNTWTGHLGLKLKNLSNNSIVDIIAPQYVTLNEGETHNLVRPSSPILSTPGNYEIIVQRKTSGSNIWVDVSESVYENPLPIEVVEGAAEITILTPNGNENYTSGQNINITWTSVGIGSNVSIEMLFSDCTTEEIILDDPSSNDGSFTWSIPNTIPDGEYKIKIYETGTGDGVDLSDDHFNITNTGLIITAPNGGESYTTDQSIPIAWTSSGIGSDVSLELINSCGTFVYDIADPTINDGSFSWPIPATIPVGTYKIKIYATNSGNGVDYSNSTFTISASGSCADGYETNNTRSSATTTVFNALGESGYSESLTDANIHINSDADFYKLSYTSSGTITCLLSNLPADYAIQLQDESGLVLETSQVPGLANEEVQFAFSGSGFFYIRVYSGGNNQSNCDPYHLLVSWLPDLPGLCTNFADLLPEETDAYNAAVCLCNLGYITPQDYNNDGESNEINANAPIQRADLAKLVFYALYEGDNPAYSDPFPVPFVDLQQYYIPYYRYAKALCYLEYGDGVSPFSRDFNNFRPYDGITKKYVLKVMLEAFNIAPDNTGPNPFTGEINIGDDAYGYVKEAHDRGYITTGGLYELLPRKYAFIILQRILSDQIHQMCGGSCDPSCHPVIQDDDYFLPGNFTPLNLGRGATPDEGFFRYASPSGFHIPGFNLDINYNHTYSSHLLELPRNYTHYTTGTGNAMTVTPLMPLGKGWTHSYHSYLMKIPGWNAAGQEVPQKIMVFWPGGAIHYYDDVSKTPDTYGVFDEMTQVSSTVMRIKSKTQMEYTFSRFGSEATHPYYMTKIQDRNDNTINIIYEAKNGGHRIKEIEDTGGRFLKFYYQNGTNYLIQVKDVAGSRNLYYNINTTDQNLTTYTNPRGKIATYGYGTGHKKNLLMTITQPEGNVITNSYGEQNKLEQTQVANGTESVLTTFSQSYDFTNEESFIHTTRSDQQGTIINKYFNQNGFQEMVSIGSAEIDYVYIDSLLPSLPTSISYEDKNASIEYDDKGNVEKITLPLGVIHEYDYTSLNDIAWYKDPKGKKSYMYYDTKGNIDYVLDNMGYKTDFTINNKGLVTSIENPENIVQTFSYDNYGNKTNVTAPLGIQTEMEYDLVGRLKQVTNPLDQITEYLYDAHNQIKQTTQHASTGNIVTKIEYDDNDNKIWIENAKGHKTIMSYNDRDQLESSTFGNDTKAYSYLNDGLLDTYEKPGGTGTFQYTYDPLGRLEDDGHTTYTYWGNKPLIKDVIKDGNTVTFYYDALDRLDYYIDYYNKTVNYDYDLNGNISRITYPGGFVVDYVYDHNNRLSQVKWDNPVKKVQYSYRKDGKLKKMILPNDTYTDYDYDDAGRMTSLINKKSNGTVISSYSFELDLLGNHLSENPVEQFGPPTLQEETIVSTYNGENEILTSGSTTYSHDANGNQILRGTVATEWDIYDMMTEYGNDAFEYDGTGLRRKVTRDGSIIKYIWDVQGIKNILMEMDNAGMAQNYYIHGLGLIARKQEGSGSTHYYHYDYRGSTIAMTDEDENITHQYQYAPFGAILNMTEANANPFTYVGKHGVMNEGDSVLYMRARYYDCAQGRFISEDPVWSTNLYSYCENNPIINLDATGRIMGPITFAVTAGELISNTATGLLDQGEAVFNSIDAYASGNYELANEFAAQANEIGSETWKTNAIIAVSAASGEFDSKLVDIVDVTLEPALILIDGGKPSEAASLLVQNIVANSIEGYIDGNIPLKLEGDANFIFDRSIDYMTENAFNTIDILNK